MTTKDVENAEQRYLICKNWLLKCKLNDKSPSEIIQLMVKFAMSVIAHVICTNGYWKFDILKVYNECYHKAQIQLKQPNHNIPNESNLFN